VSRDWHSGCYCEGMYRFAFAILAASSVVSSSTAYGDDVAPVTEAPIAAEASPDAGKKPIWKGMVIAGGVLAGVSAVWVGSGLAMYLSDPPNDDDWFDGLGRGQGTAFMIVGAGIAAISVPFLAVGFADPRTTPVRVEVVAEGAGLAVRGTF
jgi:hypothetical protein